MHEIAILRLELDTVKNQNQEMERKYFEDIAILKEKNNRLQKIIKLNEETLTKIVFQYKTAENKMLIAERENVKQKTGNRS